MADYGGFVSSVKRKGHIKDSRTTVGEAGYADFVVLDIYNLLDADESIRWHSTTTSCAGLGTKWHVIGKKRSFGS